MYYEYVSSIGVHMRNFIYTLALTVLALPAQADLSLVMYEEQGCIWCAQWNAEIAPIYPKTPEGQSAPLRRIDANDPLPANLTFKSKPHFTPTFILMDDGSELSRLEGYPGEDFFWGLLGVMLEQAGTTPLSKDQ